MLFSKVTNAVTAASNGRVSASFDMVETKEQAHAMIERCMNGGAAFIALIPALPLDQLAEVERKDKDSGVVTKTGKLALTGEVSPLQLQSADGAVVRVSPGRGNFWLGFDLVSGPVKRIGPIAA